MFVVVEGGGDAMQSLLRGLLERKYLCCGHRYLLRPSIDDCTQLSDAFILIVFVWGGCKCYRRWFLKPLDVGVGATIQGGDRKSVV